MADTIEERREILKAALDALSNDVLAATGKCVIGLCLDGMTMDGAAKCVVEALRATAQAIEATASDAAWKPES